MLVFAGASVEFIFFVTSISAVQSSIGGGLLAELFAPFEAADSCDVSATRLGSTWSFAGRLPAISVPLTQGLEFKTMRAFLRALNPCTWTAEGGTVGGPILYECRDVGSRMKTFGLRLSGMLVIWKPGDYTFEVAADDGGRVIIGHDHHCSHDDPLFDAVCGTWNATSNARLGALNASWTNDFTFVQHCGLCQFGHRTARDVCWFTDTGCQPYALWQLEADGGLQENCGRGLQRRKGSRWLAAGSHPFRAEYFHRTGEAEFRIWYSGPDTNQKRLIVPVSALVPPPGKGKLFTEWFEKPLPVPHAKPRDAGTRPGTLLWHEISAMGNNWAGAHTRFNGIVSSLKRPLLVRWSGVLIVEVAGNYEFRLESDGTAEVFLGGRGSKCERRVVSVEVDASGCPKDKGHATMMLQKGTHPFLAMYWHVQGHCPGQRHGVSLNYSGPDTRHLSVPINANSADDRPYEGPVQWKGPDTVYVKPPPKSSSYAFVSPHDVGDNGCDITRLTPGCGASSKRECDGNCLGYGEEIRHHDGVCDAGPQRRDKRGRIVANKKNLNCSAYAFDGGDCVQKPVWTHAKDDELFECWSSCPREKFGRFDCRRCDPAISDKARGLCAETGPAKYEHCCLAKLENLEDAPLADPCVAYGAGQEGCRAALESSLEVMRLKPRPPHVQAGGERPMGTPTGEVFKECEEDFCNNARAMTGSSPLYAVKFRDTLQCPTEADAISGLNCFEGPWKVIGVYSPVQECQAIAERNLTATDIQEFISGVEREAVLPTTQLINFCRNNRTSGGQGFKRCCSMATFAPDAGLKCIFIGLAVGTCQDYLNVYRDTGSAGFLIDDCAGHMCNKPFGEECPGIVSDWHAPDLPQTDIAQTSAPTIIIMVGLFSSLCFLLFLWTVRKCCQQVLDRPAKIAAEDTVQTQTFHMRMKNRLGLQWPRPDETRIRSYVMAAMGRKDSSTQKEVIAVVDPTCQRTEKVLKNAAAEKGVDVGAKRFGHDILRSSSAAPEIPHKNCRASLPTSAIPRAPERRRHSSSASCVQRVSQRVPPDIRARPPPRIVYAPPPSEEPTLYCHRVEPMRALEAHPEARVDNDVVSIPRRPSSAKNAGTTRSTRRRPSTATGMRDAARRRGSPPVLEVRGPAAPPKDVSSSENAISTSRPRCLRPASAPSLRTASVPSAKPAFASERPGGLRDGLDRPVALNRPASAARRQRLSSEGHMRTQVQ